MMHQRPSEVILRGIRQIRPSFLVLIAVFLLFSPFGCGAKRPECVPVSGRVIIDGRPLTLGVVRLIPENARPSQGRIDKDGRFKLTSFSRLDGVTLGKHRVEVSASEPISDTQIRWHAPERYANAATSELTVEITGPTDDLVIQLSSK